MDRERREMFARRFECYEVAGWPPLLFCRRVREQKTKMGEEGEIENSEEKAKTSCVCLYSRRFCFISTMCVCVCVSESLITIHFG